MDGSDDRNESSLFLDRNLTFFSKQIQAIRFVWIGVLMIPSWAAPLSAGVQALAVFENKKGQNKKGQAQQLTGGFNLVGCEVRFG